MPKTKIGAKKSVRKPVAKSKPASRTAKKSLHSPYTPEKTRRDPHPIGGYKPTKVSGVSVSVMDSSGKPASKMTLPAELFAATVNKALLAQAVRVHLANQREGGASTKTRGQVEGSTRKIYRQKGTGRARHGAIRAPIFVGGGITFGPTTRSYRLEFPKKMKRAALASALTSAYQESKMIVVDGLAGVVKTKNMAKSLHHVGANGSTLLVVTGDARETMRAARNIAGLDILPAQNLHAYAVVAHQKVVFMKEAVEVLKETFL